MVRLIRETSGRIEEAKACAGSRRWYAALVVTAAGLLALLLVLRGFYRQEIFHYTGDAEWMWLSDEVRISRPTSALLFTELHLNDYPQRAVVKVCGERQYVLWINGQPVLSGRNRPRFHLDVTEVTDLLVAGDNLIALEVRSHTSVGAALLAMDLRPSAEGRRAGDPRGRNVLVSGPRWRVIDHWDDRPDLLPAGTAREPWIWGRPPDHPWGYPPPVVHQRPIVQAMVSEPIRLEADDFRQAAPGTWIARIDRRVTGFMWVRPDPGLEGARAGADGARPQGPAAGGVDPGLAQVGVREAWPPGSAGAPGDDLVPVVRLPGEELWLFPGWISGNVVVVRAAAPPELVEVVEGLGGPPMSAATPR